MPVDQASGRNQQARWQTGGCWLNVGLLPCGAEDLVLPDDGQEKSEIWAYVKFSGFGIWQLIHI